MNKLIYIVLFITAFCQGQIINSYAYTVVAPSELYNFTDASDYTTETATIKTTNDGNGYWASVSGIIEVAGVGQTDTTTAQDGDYCMKITNTGTSGRGEIRLPVIIGDQYTIKMWAKQGVGVNRIGYWAGLVVTPSPVDVAAVWTEYTYNVEASATGTVYIRFYTQLGGTSGEYMYLDNISIVKTN